MKPSSIPHFLSSLALASILLASPALAGPKVVMTTSKGEITIELDEEKAPETVANFLQYVEEGFYDGTVFHRVIEGFMIQGGGFAVLEDGAIEQKETRDPIQNEAANGLKNERGTIAMARLSDPHSATAQFFINHSDNANLDHPSFDGWGYAVFGRVVEGLDVLDAIAEVSTGERQLVSRFGDEKMARSTENVPVENIVIESVKRQD